MKDQLFKATLAVSAGLGALASAGAGGAGDCAAAQPQPHRHRQPNIVLIVADDLGWSDVGWEGAALIPTPNLTRLAREGVRFTQFYTAPTCSPSRACLMTGQSGPRHGIYAVDNFGGAQPDTCKVLGVRSRQSLPPGTVTLATVLRSAGYATASIGKWHLGDSPDTMPEAQGFDLNIGGSAAGKPQSYFAPYGNLPLAPRVENEYLTDRLADEARDYVAAPRDKPFFLYFAFYAPHVPLHALSQYMPENTGAGAGPPDDAPVPPYHAMVAHLDACAGRVIAALPPASAGRETVVVFISDNGGQLMVTSNRPLRGQKGTLHEGGIRVPAFLWRNGAGAATRVETTPVCLQDLMPTLAEIAGAALPAGHALDGESLLPLLRGGRLRRDALFLHLPNYTGANACNANLWQTPGGVIRMGDWKLIENLEDGGCELYNLADDIGETRNLAAVNPALAKKLLARLHEWQKTMNAPVRLPPNPAYKPESRGDLTKANTREKDEWRPLARVR